MERKKKNFRWRYQPLSNSNYDTLLSYVDNKEIHPSVSKKEMILNALSAYYMPLAYSAAEKPPEILQQIAYDSVLALQRQIDRLVSQYQLDRSMLGPIGSEVVNKSSNQEEKEMSGQTFEPEDSFLEEERVNVEGLLRMNSYFAGEDEEN